MAAIGRHTIFGGRRPSTHFAVNRVKIPALAPPNGFSFVVDALGQLVEDSIGTPLIVANG